MNDLDYQLSVCAHRVEVNVKGSQLVATLFLDRISVHQFSKTGQQAPGILWSLHPQFWDYRCALLCTTFQGGRGAQRIRTQVYTLARQAFYWLSHLLRLLPIWQDLEWLWRQTLSVSLKAVLEKFNQGEKTHPECGWQCSTVWDVGDARTWRCPTDGAANSSKCRIWTCRM